MVVKHQRFVFLLLWCWSYFGGTKSSSWALVWSPLPLSSVSCLQVNVLLMSLESPSKQIDYVNHHHRYPDYYYWNQNHFLLSQSQSQSSNDELSFTLQQPHTIISEPNEEEEEKEDSVSTISSQAIIRLNKSLQQDWHSHRKQYQKDTVVRILDANTIKLKTGLVSLAGVQTPTTGGFPVCTSTDPSKQVRKLLPNGSVVHVRRLSQNNKNDSQDSSASIKRVLLLVDNNDNQQMPLFINAALVQSGYAKPVARGREAAEQILPGFTQALQEWHQQAQQEHVGMYQLCSDSGTVSVKRGSAVTATTTNTANIDLDTQFEPLPYATQIQWGIDGSKTVRVDNTPKQIIPANPGDTKGCSDFDTYEQALSWYEKYAPYYGDVAQLDRDGDGVPCPKLPHTTNMERYRRKVPITTPAATGKV